MKLTKIQTRNFRNLRSLDLEFDPSVNIIIGDNGAGKTNLLEALEVLITGSSFRCNDVSAFVSKESQINGFALQAELTNQGMQHSVSFKLQDNRKTLTVDNKRVSIADLRRRFGVVLFSPESLNLLKAGPSVRRQAIDDVMFGLRPSSLKIVAQYGRCLKSRNRVLKDLKEYPNQSGHREVLKSLNPSFLYLATKYTYERILTLRHLSERYPALVQEILKNQTVEVSFDYVVSSKSAIDWQENQVYDALDLRMKELASSEIDSGQSLVGPQKHEVRFLFQGQDSRVFCSQGQQRSLILGLKMAQVELQKEANGSFPILLLDDVFSELDLQRQQSLLNCLKTLDAQIFITNTAFDLQNRFAGKSETVFVVEKGRLKKEDGLSVRESNTITW